MIHEAAIFVCSMRFAEPMLPEVSMTMTTSLAPEAAEAYQPRKRMSEQPEHVFSVKHW